MHPVRSPILSSYGRQPEDFDEFIAALSEHSIDPDTDEMTAVFQDAGFKGSGVDTRFFGETHTPGSSPHVVSSFIELESEDGATSALDWFETDSKKPCPMSCAAQISAFDVDDIPDARGVQRIATAEDIERVGRADERPNEEYWIGFTNGAFVYTVNLFGPPGLYLRSRLWRSQAPITTGLRAASAPGA